MALFHHIGKNLVHVNPRCMCESYGNRSIGVCVSVCYRASCYISHVYIENWVPLGFSCCSQCMYCVDFIDKSYGEICWSPLPSSLLDKLFMDKRDSNGFFSRRLTCRTSNMFNHSTDSSLVTVDYQQRASWLSFSVVANCWSGTCMVMLHIT